MINIFLTPSHLKQDLEKKIIIRWKGFSNENLTSIHSIWFLQFLKKLPFSIKNACIKIQIQKTT